MSLKWNCYVCQSNDEAIDQDQQSSNPGQQAGQNFARQGVLVGLQDPTLKKFLAAMHRDEPSTPFHSCELESYTPTFKA